MAMANEKGLLPCAKNPPNFLIMFPHKGIHSSALQGPLSLEILSGDVVEQADR